MSDTELKIEKLTEGTGEAARKGEKVTVHYTGWLTDGSKFDSSVDRDDPFVFVLGAGQVIQGWDEGVATMKVGDKVKLTIPHHMAYGEQGYPGAIPPKATLLFDVELLKVG
jgi:FKBP-type peptidyl-prolyl cis-trans isomerase